MNNKHKLLVLSIGLGISGIVGMNAGFSINEFPAGLIIFIIGFILGIAGLIIGFKNGKNFSTIINFVICTSLYILCFFVSYLWGYDQGRQDEYRAYNEMINPTPVEEPIEYSVEKPIENPAEEPVRYSSDVPFPRYNEPYY